MNNFTWREFVRAAAWLALLVVNTNTNEEDD